MATIQIRMPDEDKQEVEHILKSMGLDMTTAVRMFFKQVTVENGLPFQPKSNLTVNGFTPEFEEEVLRAAQEEDFVGPFDTAEEFIASLQEEK